MTAGKAGEHKGGGVREGRINVFKKDACMSPSCLSGNIRLTWMPFKSDFRCGTWLLESKRGVSRREGGGGTKGLGVAAVARIHQGQ